MSSLLNKAKEAAREVLSSDKRDNTHSTTGGNYADNPQSTNAGPHSSNLANKVDPRIDSDRDGRNDPMSRTGGYGNTQDTYGASGVGHGSTGAGYGSTGAGVGSGNIQGTAVQYDDPRSTNAGPHSSNIANKLDPRVDSDMDRRNNPASNIGGYGQTQQGYSGGTGLAANTAVPEPHHGHHGHQGHQAGYGAGAGVGNTQGGISNTQYDNPRSTNDGPHSSDLMNKLDPRVDSDRDGRNDPASNVGGYGQTQQGYGAGGGLTDTSMPGAHHGHHGHQEYQAGYGAGAGAGVGHTQGGISNTQYDNPRSTNDGPHASNLMNKVDPRVDSDRDGRNNPASNVGGYGQTQQGYGSGGGFTDTNVPGAHTGQHPGYAAGPGAGAGFVDSGVHGGHQGHQGHQGHHGHHGHHATPGSGDANRTAGPHDSNLLNKLDPRVDSDMDGSKTFGGDRTNY